MSSAEFHYLCGKYVGERERALGIRQKSLLSRGAHGGCPGVHVVARATRRSG